MSKTLAGENIEKLVAGRTQASRFRSNFSRSHTTSQRCGLVKILAADAVEFERNGNARISFVATGSV